MKKRGFSLAELLVAMSIIAVAAALLVPSYMNFRPDRYKFRVLNAYKLILETNDSLLNNPDIYFQLTPPVNDPQINNQEGCRGLFCTLQPNANTEFNNVNYSGVCKYPNLMKAMLNLTPSNVLCTGTDNSVSGTAPDTSLWTITNVLAPDNQGNIGYQISVDLDPRSTSPNCSYSASCTHPDTFTFYVNRNGDIDLNYPENLGGMDALTKTYIRNMENIYKQNDYDQAAQGG